MNIFNNKNEDSVLNTINSIVNKNILEEGGGGQKAPDKGSDDSNIESRSLESLGDSKTAELDQGFGVWSALAPTSFGSYAGQLAKNKVAFDANKELNKGKSPGQQASEAQARSIAADPIGYNPTIIEDPEKRLTPRHQFDLDTRFPVAFPTSPTIPVINPIGNVMNNLFKKMYPTAQQLSLNANRRAQQSIANIQPTNNFVMAEAVISSPLQSSILTAQPSSVNVTKQENTSSTANSTAKNKKVTAIGNSNTAIGNPDYTLSNNGNLASAESQLPKGAASTRQPIYPGNEEQVSNEIPLDSFVPAPVAPVAAAPFAAAPVAAAPVAPATSNRQPIQPGNKKEIDNQLSVDQVVAPIINTTNTRPGSVENTGASIVNKQNPVGTPNASGSAIKTPFVAKPQVNAPATNPGFMTSPQGAPPPEPPRRSSQTGDFKVTPVNPNTPASNPGFMVSPQGAPSLKPSIQPLQSTKPSTPDISTLSPDERYKKTMAAGNFNGASIADTASMKEKAAKTSVKKETASDVVGGAAAAGADYRNNLTAPEGYDNKRGMTRADFNAKRDAAEEAAYPGSTKGRPARGGGSNVGLSSSSVGFSSGSGLLKPVIGGPKRGESSEEYQTRVNDIVTNFETQRDANRRVNSRTAVNESPVNRDSVMMKNNKELSTIKTILSEGLPTVKNPDGSPVTRDSYGIPVLPTTTPRSSLKAKQSTPSHTASMYLNMPAIEVARLGLGQMGSLVGPDLDKARFKFFREKLSTPLDAIKGSEILNKIPGLGNLTKFAKTLGGQVSSPEDIADAEMDRAANFQNQLQNDFRTPTYTTQTRSSKTAELQAAREKMSGSTGP